MPNKRSKIPFILGALGCGMFAFAFAIVPFYRLYCKLVGKNRVILAKKAQPLSSKETNKALKRNITVEFDVTNNDENPFVIQAHQRTLTVHPGKMYSTYFTAHNDSNRPMTLQAIPSFTPGVSGYYFKKTECFCFRQQHLKPKQTVNMPLIFYVDPEMPKSVKTLTLSYTVFKIV